MLVRPSEGMCRGAEVVLHCVVFQYANQKHLLEFIGAENENFAFEGCILGAVNYDYTHNYICGDYSNQFTHGS